MVRGRLRAQHQTEFTLDVSVNGTETLQTRRIACGWGSAIRSGLRVTDDGQGFVIDPGAIITPSPQQRASEGGDIVIRYGETLTGTISNERLRAVLPVQRIGRRPGEIRAERLTGDLDPMLVLRDAADTTLPNGSNDDADASTQDARLVYTLPADGTYIIAVTRYGVRDGTTTGDFRLTLNRTGY